MRVAIVFPKEDTYSNKMPLRDPNGISLGVSYISSVLKRGGHSTRLFVLTRGNARNVETQVNHFSSGLVCFTAVSTTYWLIRRFAARYKAKRPNVWLVAGGSHVSLNPEAVIADSFDAICVGEGEYPVLKLANQLERAESPSGIRNLWIRNSSGIERNPTRPFLEDLDELPFPDRVMWDRWIQYPDAKPTVLISRGCPFNCSYCSNYKLASLASGKYCRFRSPDRIVDEVKELLAERPRIKEVYFENETIGINLQFAFEFCSALEQLQREREQPVAFGINLRVTPNAQYGPLFAALERANFKSINIGLESGSERVRSKILRRVYSNDDIVGAVALAKRHGLSVKLYVMVGIPGETPDDFRQTIELCRKCQANKYSLSVFFPYPGTELATLCEEQGLIDPKAATDGVRERIDPVLNQPDFPKRKVMWSYVCFDYDVYRGYKPFYKRLILLMVRGGFMASPFLQRLSKR